MVAGTAAAGGRKFRPLLYIYRGPTAQVTVTASITIIHTPTVKLLYTIVQNSPLYKCTNFCTLHTYNIVEYLGIGISCKT